MRKAGSGQECDLQSVTGAENPGRAGTGLGSRATAPGFSGLHRLSVMPKRENKSQALSIVPGTQSFSIHISN